MNILIISPINIFLRNHGAARRISDLSDSLAFYDNKVTVICLLEPYRNRRAEDKTQHNAKIIGVPLSWILLLPLIILYYSIPADVVQLEFPTFSPIVTFLKLLRKPIILDEHGVETYLIREVEGLTKKRFNNLRYALTLFSEWLAVKISSLVFVCSDHDAKKIEATYKVPSDKILTIPNGVSNEFLSHVEAFNYSKQAVVFVGDYNHPPNFYAAQVIINDILPTLQKEKNDFIFVFVGRDPPQLIVQNRKRNFVEVFANVRDVRPYVAGADVAIAPIYHGSGTRIKILEYMALAKPVISTSKGVEGLEVYDGKNVLIRNTPKEFAEAIRELLSNEKLAMQIGKNGQKLIMEKYLWKNIVRKVIKVYEDLLN